MRRHLSLISLSREHHGALILARLLQKDAPPYNGLPRGIEEKSLYAQKFYLQKLVNHFDEEEKNLKLVTGISTSLDALVRTILLEHQELHASFRSITTGPNMAALEDKLGVALESHIRKEERELFPLIETTCSETLMNAISNSLSAHG